MEEKKKECSKCNKGLSKSQWSLFTLSMYLLVSSLYGTYIMISKIISLF